MDRVTELIAKLKDPDWLVRYTAAALLGQIGTPSVPALIAVLQDRSVHGEAARALGQDLVEVFGYEMGENESDIAANEDMLRLAAKALGQIATTDPAPVLRSALPILRRLQKRDPVFLEALNQIEATMAGVKDLPLPAAAPLPDATSLPRPTTAPTLSPDGLPIPSAPSDVNTNDHSGQGFMTRSHRSWLRRGKRH